MTDRTRPRAPSLSWCAVLWVASMLVPAAALPASTEGAERTDSGPVRRERCAGLADSCLFQLAEQERRRSFLQSCGPIAGSGFGFAAGGGAIVLGSLLSSSSPQPSEAYARAAIITSGLSFFSISAGALARQFKSAEAAYYGRVEPIDRSTLDGAARREQVAGEILTDLAGRDKTMRTATGLSTILLGAATAATLFAYIASGDRNGGGLGAGGLLGAFIVFCGVDLLSRHTEYEKAFDRYNKENKRRGTPGNEGK